MTWRSSCFEAPTHPAASRNRPMLRMFTATLKPCPTSPRTFSAGTGAFSRKTDAVEDPRTPILCSSSPTETPGVVRSTRKQVCWSPSTLANTLNRSAKDAFEINCFAPESRKNRPFGDRAAFVRMAIASDPVEVGDDFPFGEVARRLRDQPMLVGERLGREHVTRFRLPDEEAAAGDRSANPFGVHPITSNCVYLVYLVFLVYLV